MPKRDYVVVYNLVNMAKGLINEKQQLPVIQELERLEEGEEEAVSLLELVLVNHLLQ